MNRVFFCFFFPLSIINLVYTSARLYGLSWECEWRQFSTLFRHKTTCRSYLPTHYRNLHGFPAFIERVTNSSGASKTRHYTSRPPGVYTIQLEHECTPLHPTVTVRVDYIGGVRSAGSRASSPESLRDTSDCWQIIDAVPPTTLYTSVSETNGC